MKYFLRYYHLPTLVLILVLIYYDFIIISYATKEETMCITIFVYIISTIMSYLAVDIILTESQ